LQQIRTTGQVEHITVPNPAEIEQYHAKALTAIEIPFGSLV
jgi:hypothetical protein